MATERQIEANRRNAALSTGPKTEEGKAQSRGNALTHGLTATLLAEEKQAAVTARYEEWKPWIKPEGPVQEYELQNAVEASLRVENCRSREKVRQADLAAIAVEFGPKWEIDRQREADRLGRSLKRNPEEAALQLRMTPAGRKWLIGQWKTLIMAVAEGRTKPWSDAESHQALDLMGKTRLMRDLLLEQANPFADRATTRALILEEIAALEAENQDADHEMTRLRNLHVNGLIFETDATLVLIRRYETSAHRQYEKSMKAIAKAKAAPTTTQFRPASPSAVVTDPVSRNCETKPIPISVPDEKEEPLFEAPDCETKPIPAPSPTPRVHIVPAKPAETAAKTPVGNRRMRRALEKQAREQERRVRYST